MDSEMKYDVPTVSSCSPVIELPEFGGAYTVDLLRADSSSLDSLGRAGDLDDHVGSYVWFLRGELRATANSMDGMRVLEAYRERHGGVTKFVFSTSARRFHHEEFTLVDST